MKAFKTLLVAFAAIAFVGSASAQTVIRLTGSSAYRGPTHTALLHLLGAVGAGTTVSAGNSYGYTGTSLSGASQGVFKGTIAGNNVTVLTAWNGSIAGIQAVAATGTTVSVNYLDATTAATSQSGTSGLATGTVASTTSDVSMSDVYQSSSVFTGGSSVKYFTSFSQSTASAPSVSYVGLTDTVVGVVPFKWVASPGFPATTKGVTPQIAQKLFSSGQVPLALFTGSSSDEQNTVFAIGRDRDSGTRLTAFAETGVGALAAVKQYAIGGFDTVTPLPSLVTSHALTGTTTLLGLKVGSGNHGQGSGGTLAGLLRKTLSGTLAQGGTASNSAYYLTYLSTGDAGTAIAAGSSATDGSADRAAVELPYNGVTYSAAAVTSGQYTFWSYEHLYIGASAGADARNST
jgi:hypothetical protein